MIYAKGNKVKDLWLGSKKVAKAWKGAELMYSNIKIMISPNPVIIGWEGRAVDVTIKVQDGNDFQIII